MSDTVVLKSVHGSLHEADRVGSFFVTRRRIEGQPRLLYLNGQPLYRFMDTIYLPSRPYQLDPIGVRELCELRLRILSEVSNERLRSRVAELLVDTVRKLSREKPTVLDFGTGSGKLLNLLRVSLPSAKLTGTDMSFESLINAPKWATVALTAPTGPLPFESASFDIITSLFVFHFRLPASLKEDLLRIIRDTGFLIGNVYGADISSYERDMESAGWELCASIAVNGAHGHRVDAWHSRGVPCPHKAHGMLTSR